MKDKDWREDVGKKTYMLFHDVVPWQLIFLSPTPHSAKWAIP